MIVKLCRWLDLFWIFSYEVRKICLARQSSCKHLPSPHRFPIHYATRARPTAMTVFHCNRAQSRQWGNGPLVRRCPLQIFHSYLKSKFESAPHGVHLISKCNCDLHLQADSGAANTYKTWAISRTPRTFCKILQMVQNNQVTGDVRNFLLKSKRKTKDLF